MSDKHVTVPKWVEQMEAELRRAAATCQDTRVSAWILNILDKGETDWTVWGTAKQTTPAPPEAPRARFLYLMRSESGLYKIGVSVNPRQRRQALRAGTRLVLKVLEQVPLGVCTFAYALKVEAGVHLRFQDSGHFADGYPAPSEWFTLTPDQAHDFASVVKEIANALFEY